MRVTVGISSCSSVVTHDGRPAPNRAGAHRVVNGTPLIRVEVCRNFITAIILSNQFTNDALHQPDPMVADSGRASLSFRTIGSRTGKRLLFFCTVTRRLYPDSAITSSYSRTAPRWNSTTVRRKIFRICGCAVLHSPSLIIRFRQPRR